MKFYGKLSLLLLLVIAVPVFAQDPPPPPQEEDPATVTPHTMVIEVGSRSPERSRTDTPVPVDVVPIEEIADESGQLDLGQLLQYVAPSFNSNRQSGSDGSDHIDAATLRGLGPDQVLVLINGKRRHTSSLVYIFGTRGRGNVGTDLNTIPVSAIERIEILRDGAAAQYGSDAIAGVINIVLRKDAGLNVLLSAGQYTAGDGQNEQIAVNYGIPIGQTGALSLTGEMLNRDKTNRATPSEPRVIGDSATENLTLFYNLDVPTNDTSSFYGHGGYNGRDGLAGAWYRDGVGSDDIPSRNSAQMYPSGFVPDIGTDIRDFSAAFGYRTLVGPWSMDVSTTYGSNRMEFIISKTLNASIATLNNGVSPDSFDAGGFEFMQHTTNLDFSRYYKDWLGGVSVAAGLEYRRENYEIFAGEPGSYGDFDGPGGGNAGSQGFPGFQPVDEVDADRNSKAAYVDLEFRTTPKLLLTGALRGEDYNDFGNTVNGKVSFAYAANTALNLRGSASTGFRAPSLHQRYFSSTFTDFIAGEAADVKLARNDSELARLVGIPALKEEESLNFSLGLTWNPRTSTSLTFDVYQIDIDDRIVLTGGFTPDDADIGHIIEAENLAEARFFTNAIDTQTRGVDVSITNSRTIGTASLTLAGALNLNETEVERINTSPGLIGKEDIYFSQRERMFVEGSAPKTKGALSADYRQSRWNTGARVSYFGEVESGTWSQLDDPNSPPQHYDARFSTDVHFGYELPNNVTLTVGGANIFDEQPTAQDPNETENGALWENVQMGFNGAAYFVRLNWKMPGR
ncbi:MAG TPA: TonB-dependent receptor [Thermoanaerobaculia bacterium]|jgi:iron complex outermembrane receptor protein|nr:TonB-dependent receptor [Thermoanaerobaculia bacterium]